MSALTSFTAKFDGGLSIEQRTTIAGKSRASANFHRLTPEQFDALTQVFDLDTGYGIEATIDVLTVPETGKQFRSARINMGGLLVSLFSDVVEPTVDPNQLSFD